MVRVHEEIAFEDAIERAMLASGWLPGQAANYRRGLGLHTAELFTCDAGRTVGTARRPPARERRHGHDEKG